ncbi:acetylcholine-gated cation-selective channel [Branchiostoma belcheri]|nr:acetylcholine-gated cation-selective channel [Branchiostoma belcheri]
MSQRQYKTSSEKLPGTCRVPAGDRPKRPIPARLLNPTGATSPTGTGAIGTEALPVYFTVFGDFEARQLKSHLMLNYDPGLRPVTDVTHQTTVEVGIDFRQVIEIVIDIVSALWVRLNMVSIDFRKVIKLLSALWVELNMTSIDFRQVFDIVSALWVKLNMLSIDFRQVIEMDEKNQIMTSVVWLRQYWYDEALVWNSTDFWDISYVNIPSNEVWLPDTVLYNSVITFAETTYPVPPRCQYNRPRAGGTLSPTSCAPCSALKGGRTHTCFFRTARTGHARRPYSHARVVNPQTAQSFTCTYSSTACLRAPKSVGFRTEAVLTTHGVGNDHNQLMTNVVINSAGYVTWMAPRVFRSSCNIDIYYFPFDDQKCLLEEYADHPNPGYRKVFRKG